MEAVVGPAVRPHHVLHCCSTGWRSPAWAKPGTGCKRFLSTCTTWWQITSNPWKRKPLPQLCESCTWEDQLAHKSSSVCPS